MLRLGPGQGAAQLGQNHKSIKEKQSQTPANGGRDELSCGSS